VKTAEGFRDAIDTSCAAERSVVLRYRDAVRLADDDGEDRRLKELLAATSIREGVRLVPLGVHRDVRIDVLDETSLMRTRTLKSIDGCVTIAHCLARGDQGIVFESGANTGTALTVYGNRHGLDTFLFAPAENLDLLDAGAFAGPGAHVFAVDRPGDVKRAAAEFAAERGLPRVPELAWRIQASTFVGCFLLEQLLAGERFDVLAQSISAGFGPIGIYRVLGARRDAIGALPAFLGVQQAANAPMVDAWRARSNGSAGPVPSTSGLLARVMYDGEPGSYGTFGELRGMLDESEGTLATVDAGEFEQAIATRVEAEPVLRRLAARDVRIATRPDGSVLDKTGLLALAGTVRAIEAGEIAPGSRVLVCLTGGTARPHGRVEAARRNGAAGG
jgi:threonine synthase